MNVHLDDISSNAECFVTKFGMVMHHLVLECHARRLVCCLQVQGRIGGLYISSMTVSIISAKLLIFLHRI